MKAVVAAFNQEKALVGAFSVITNLRMELFGALIGIDNFDNPRICGETPSILPECATWRVVKKTDMRTGLQQPPVRREGEGFMHMMPLVLMSSHQILADESLV